MRRVLIPKHHWTLTEDGWKRPDGWRTVVYPNAGKGWWAIKQPDGRFLIRADRHRRKFKSWAKAARVVAKFAPLNVEVL